MANEKGDVVGVVREWQPSHDTDLPNIERTIDSWDRKTSSPASTARPTRDYAAIEAAVDRLTKRVKTRKVVVKETITEYVDEEGPVEVHAASPSHAVDEATVPTVPVEETKADKKLGWFARRKQAKAEKAAKPEPVFNVVAPAPAATPATATSNGDAWDPGTVRQVEAPKPLQSKAAKRTAGKTAKKASKKR